MALPCARGPSPGDSRVVSGCSVPTGGVPGEPQARQQPSAGCQGAGLCLSAAVTRGLQAAFGRIIYTSVYISYIIYRKIYRKALRCSSCTLGEIK